VRHSKIGSMTFWVRSGGADRDDVAAHVRFAPKSGQVGRHLGMFALCHERTHALQQATVIGGAEQRQRDSAAERLGEGQLRHIFSSLVT
jgi:hypothetical protein